MSSHESRISLSNNQPGGKLRWRWVIVPLTLTVCPLEAKAQDNPWRDISPAQVHGSSRIYAPAPRMPSLAYARSALPPTSTCSLDISVLNDADYQSSETAPSASPYNPEPAGAVTLAPELPDWLGLPPEGVNLKHQPPTGEMTDGNGSGGDTTERDGRGPRGVRGSR